MNKLKILLAPEGDGGGTAVAEPPAKSTPTSSPSDPFSTIDKRATAPRQKAPTPEKEKPKVEPKTEPKTEKSGIDKVEIDKAINEPEPEKEKADDTEPKKDKTGKTFKTPSEEARALANKELREAHERASEENKKLSTKIAEYESRISEAEKKGKDTQALTDRLTALEKERDEAQAALRAAKFEASKDYKDKFEKPFNIQAGHARRVVEGLEIEVKDRDGQVIGTRPAKFSDFERLYHMDSDPSEEAERVFGRNSGRVVNMIDKLKELKAVADAALDEEKAAFKTREDEAKANAAKKAKEDEARKDTLNKKWVETNKSVADSHPEWQADPKEPEEGDLLKESYGLVDSIYGAKDWTDEQKINYDANIRHRAATQPLYAFRLQRAQERIAELEAQLKGQEESEPGRTERGGGGPAKGDLDFNADLRKSLA